MALEDKIEDLSTRVGKAINDLLPDTWYQRSDLPLPQQTSIQIYKTSVMINGKVYKNTSATTLNLNDGSSWDNSTYATAANRAGKDFYIYACAPASGTVPVFKLSANSTVATGYSATTSRKLGGFHCLCLAVGTIEGHTLSGYATGDILPASVWDLRHHAYCGSEGMVFHNGLWCDIYLAGWDGSKLVSSFGATIADGNTGCDRYYTVDDGNVYSISGACGENLVEFASYVGKQLVSRAYFMSIAEGSPQRTAILGEAQVTTTGGHYDTENVRMISNCGCEDCCGVYYQWTSDLCDSSTIWYDSLDSDARLNANDLTDTLYTKNKYLSNRMNKWREESVFEAKRATLGYRSNWYNRTGRGSAYNCTLRRLYVGGRWTTSVCSGSRAVGADSLSSARFTGYSTRLCAEAYES